MCARYWSKGVNQNMEYRSQRGCFPRTQFRVPSRTSRYYGSSLGTGSPGNLGYLVLLVLEGLNIVHTVVPVDEMGVTVDEVNGIFEYAYGIVRLNQDESLAESG